MTLPTPRARAAALAGLLAALAGSGCERGTRFECTCGFLTDYDDASKQVVDVCAPSPERASEFAKGCAQSGAPAPIHSCACRPTSGEPCRAGQCSSR
jgi:hypothetical protein